jgi:hypothetical protein
MNRNKKKVLYAAGLLVLILLGALAYSLIRGKLLPYSPVIIGFDRRELSHTIIYIQKGNQYTNYDWIDSIPAMVEAFHELQFKAKPKIFFFDNVVTYARRSISKARFCAYPNGAVVVSPWAQVENAEGKISMRVYLTHELSHSLLHQNSGLLACFQYPKWLLEGIATYSSNQMGTFVYPSKAETYALIRQGNWLPPAIYGTSGEPGIKLAVKYRMTFLYSEFACIVDDLIARYGRERFLRYMKALIKDSRHDAVFKDSFGMDFDRYLEDFKNRIAFQ